MKVRALERAAEIEALDLICDFGEAESQDMVALLRPDMVIEDGVSALDAPTP